MSYFHTQFTAPSTRIGFHLFAATKGLRCVVKKVASESSATLFGLGKGRHSTARPGLSHC